MKVKGLKRIQDFMAYDLANKFDISIDTAKALKRLETVDVPNETAQIFLGNDWVDAVIEDKPKKHKKSKKTIDLDLDEQINNNDKEE